MQQFQNARLPVRVDLLHDLLLIVIIGIPVFGTFFPLSTYVGSSATGRGATIVLALILLVIAVLFAQHPQKSIFAFKRTWLIFAFAGWALCTSIWAESPSESFNRSGRLVIYSLYAIYLVEILEPRRAGRILGFAFLLSLACSLLAIAAIPGLASTTDGRGILGTWRGAMAHKNSLGILAGLGFLFGLIMIKTGGFDRRLSYLLAGLGAVLLVLANSVTAVLGSLVMLSFLFFAFYLLPLVGNRLMAFLLVGVFVLAGALCVYSLGSVLALFGRDSTLTGRAEIWAFTNMMIDQNPFWGYGHGAWKSPMFAKRALAAVHFRVAHSHNTWLDLRFQLGLPGFLLAIAMTLIAAKNVFYLLLTRRMADIVVPLTVLVLTGVRSYSETVVVDPALSDMFWFAFAYTALARLAMQERGIRSRQRSAHTRLRGAGDSGFQRRFGAQPIVFGEPMSRLRDQTR